MAVTGESQVKPPTAVVLAVTIVAGDAQVGLDPVGVVEA
jgi:hypothetical protein